MWTQRLTSVKGVKGPSQLWDRADLDTSFFALKIVYPNLKSKYISNSASISVVFCFIFNNLLKKTVFECAFGQPLMLFLSYLVKNDMYRVSVICKLAMKWYLMRMCATNSSLFSVSPREINHAKIFILKI